MLFWIGIFIQNQVHGRIDGVEVTRESLQKTEESLNKRFDTLEELSTQKQVHGRIDGVEENLKKTEESLNKRFDTLEAQLSTNQGNQQRFEIQQIQIQLQEMQVCVSDLILF